MTTKIDGYIIKVKYDPKHRDNSKRHWLEEWPPPPHVLSIEKPGVMAIGPAPVHIHQFKKQAMAYIDTIKNYEIERPSGHPVIFK